MSAVGAVVKNGLADPTVILMTNEAPTESLTVTLAVPAVSEPTATTFSPISHPVAIAGVSVNTVYGLTPPAIVYCCDDPTANVSVAGAATENVEFDVAPDDNPGDPPPPPHAASKNAISKVVKKDRRRMMISLVV